MADDISPGLDHRPKQVHNKWTEYQRVVVCCLYRFYKLENSAIKDIFNSIFAAELRSCGFGDAGMRYGSIHTQWHDMRAKGHSIWRQIHIETRSRPEKWANVLVNIEQAAKSLGIELVRKHLDDSDISKFKPKTPNKSHVLVPASVPTPVSIQTAPDRNNSVDEETTSTSNPTHPSSHRNSEIEVRSMTICAKGCLWCFWEGKDPFLSGHADRTGQNDQDPTSESDYVCREPPPLLYRWYNDDSQGVNSAEGMSAGLFARIGEDQVLAPGDCSVVNFKEHFLNHIQRKEIPTPLISTFMSLLAPIHRAIRAGKNAFISIINPAKSNGNIYSAQLFVRKERVRIPRYRGYGEYLVWGRIPRDAIVCTFSVADLLAICERHADVHQMLQLDVVTSHQLCRESLKMQLAQGSGRIDRFSGMTIGKLLYVLNVPFDYAGSVGARIAHNWQFSKAITSEEIDDFGLGIQTGYSLLSGSVNTITSPLPVTINALQVPLLRSDESDGEKTVFVDTSESESDSDLEADETLYPSSNSNRVVELFQAQSRTWVPLDPGRNENPGTDPIVRAEERLVMLGSLPTTVTEVACGVSNNPTIVDDDDWADDELDLVTDDVHKLHHSVTRDDEDVDDMLMILTDTTHSDEISPDDAAVDSTRAPAHVQHIESFEEERARVRRILETAKLNAS